MEEHKTDKRLLWMGLFFILLLALGLRFYGLRSQSIWFDETNGLRQITAPDLLSCFQGHPMNDEMTPLYFMVQHLWVQLVGLDIPMMRALSISFSLIAILLIFLIARRLFGVQTALAASLLMAISADQIHYAREIRVYSLYLMLALGSAYAYLHILAHAKIRWWIIALVCNLLLMWTHLFGFWMILTEGIFLLLFKPHWWKGLGLWTLAHVLSLLPLAWLVSTWALDPATDTLPPFQDIWYSYFAVDNDYITDMALTLPLPELAQDYGSFVARYLPRIAAVQEFLALFLALLCAFYLYIHRRFFLVKSHNSDTALCEKGFLLVWGFLPPLLLYTFAWAWSPEAFQLRYTLYVAPAFHLIYAAALMRLRQPKLRTLLLVLLISFYALFTLISLALPQRTDYRGIMLTLEAQQSVPETLLLCPGSDADTLQHNALAFPIRIAACREIPETLEQVELLLAGHSPQWVAIVDSFPHFSFDGKQRKRSEVVEEYLKARGITYERTTLLGENLIQLYRCHVDEGFDSITTEEGWHRLRSIQERYPREIAYAYLRVILASRLEKNEDAIEATQLLLDDLSMSDEANATLAEALGLSPSQIKVTFDFYAFRSLTQLGKALFKQGELTKANRICAQALERSPNDIEALLLAADLALESNQHDKAIQIYQDLLKRIPGLYPACERLPRLLKEQALL